MEVTEGAINVSCRLQSINNVKCQGLTPSVPGQFQVSRIKDQSLSNVEHPFMSFMSFVVHLQWRCTTNPPPAPAWNERLLVAGCGPAGCLDRGHTVCYTSMMRAFDNQL